MGFHLSFVSTPTVMFFPSIHSGALCCVRQASILFFIEGYFARPPLVIRFRHLIKRGAVQSADGLWSKSSGPRVFEDRVPESHNLLQVKLLQVLGRCYLCAILCKASHVLLRESVAR